MNKELTISLGLAYLLFKLEIAGLKRFSIMPHKITKDNRPSNKCLLFSIISLSIDYAKLVPYKDRDLALDFSE